MSEDDVKKIKTKIEGDENKFNWLLSVVKSQDVPITGANGLPSVKPGFTTFIQNSQKKSSTGSKSTGSRKKTGAAIKGADIGFINDPSENVNTNGMVNTNTMVNTMGNVNEMGNVETEETEEMESADGIDYESVEAINENEF